MFMLLVFFSGFIVGRKWDNIKEFIGGVIDTFDQG